MYFILNVCYIPFIPLSSKSSTFFQIFHFLPNLPRKKWKKWVSSTFFHPSGRKSFLPEETQPWFMVYNSIWNFNLSKNSYIWIPVCILTRKFALHMINGTDTYRNCYKLVVQCNKPTRDTWRIDVYCDLVTFNRYECIELCTCM